jgi:DNA invertase Pin-like site-specific DNA recombinase
MTKIGIGRVSTTEQNPQRQIDAFLAVGIEERDIFIDKITGNGGNLDDRVQYQLAKRVVHKGDEVYLDALDRLGRNTKEIEQEWRYFTEEIGCYMVVMNMPLLDTRPKEDGTDVSELVAKIVLNVFSWMAEQETKERKRRQKGGIEVAKREGKYKGRKPIPVGDAFFAITKQWTEGQITLSEAQKRLNMAPATFFRKCKENGIRKVEA